MGLNSNTAQHGGGGVGLVPTVKLTRLHPCS